MISRRETTVCVPAIENCSIFQSIYFKTEDANDFLRVAGYKDTMRQLLLSSSDLPGMNDIDRIPCHELTDSLEEKY